MTESYHVSITMHDDFSWKGEFYTDELEEDGRRGWVNPAVVARILFEFDPSIEEIEVTRQKSRMHRPETQFEARRVCGDLSALPNPEWIDGPYPQERKQIMEDILSAVMEEYHR